MREVLVSSAEHFCKFGCGICITKCLNQETGKIRSEKLWIFYVFRAKRQQIAPLPVFTVRVDELWWNAHWPTHLSESQGWNLPNVCSTCLTVSAYSIKACQRKIFKAGIVVKNHWRVGDKHEADSVLLIGAFRTN